MTGQSSKSSEIILNSLPNIDTEILEYIESYLQEMKSGNPGIDAEQFRDFIVPLLENFTDDTALIDVLCAGLLADSNTECALSNGKNSCEDDNETLIDRPILIKSLSYSAAAEFTLPKRTGDISLTNASSSRSKVDQKKLEKAEAKLEKKRLQQETVAKNSLIKYIDLSEDKMDYHGFNTTVDPRKSKGKSKDIRLDNFDISFGGKTILQNSNLTLAFGRKYGVIGQNGVGKSTLLRNIYQRKIVSTDKNGGIPDWLRILLVEQEITGDDTTVLASVLSSDAYQTDLLRQEKTLNKKMQEPGITAEEKDKLSMQLKEVYQCLVEIEWEKAEARAALILNGLGFTNEEMTRPTKLFSGGWRMRIALARALFCKPDVLLCDEPTNHLDLKAVIWLQRYLCSWPNTLVVVSHDRDFLDEVVTDIIHLHNESLDQYSGNFSSFLTVRAERRKNEIKEFEAQKQYREHLQSFIDRWRYNAKRAAQAQAKIKILEKLPELQPPKDDGIEDAHLKFRWPNPVDKLSQPILSASGVDFRYAGGDLLLRNVDFNIDLDSRVAIVGRNGSGKTTMLKLLIGELEPSQGIIQRNPRLRIAYFSQHHVDALEFNDNPLLSPLEFLTAKFPGFKDEEYRGTLGRFGLSGNTATQPIRTLSGGQKSRVIFALMAFINPHILVLDEITNHLDIVTIESLIKAIHPSSGFQGGVVVVSHDVRFIDKICNELWICSEGSLKKYKAANSIVDKSENAEGNSGIYEYKDSVLKEISDLKK